MFNFILGFVSGVYIGTFNHQTCKPCLDRFTDCFKKEFNRMTTSDDKSDDKDDKKN
mgnify:FL=1